MILGRTCYSWGIIIHSTDKRVSQDVSFGTEREAFLRGYYLAFSLAMGQAGPLTFWYAKIYYMPRRTNHLLRTQRTRCGRGAGEIRAR